MLRYHSYALTTPNRSPEINKMTFLNKEQAVKALNQDGNILDLSFTKKDGSHREMIAYGVSEQPENCKRLGRTLVQTRVDDVPGLVYRQVCNRTLKVNRVVHLEPENLSKMSDSVMSYSDGSRGLIYYPDFEAFLKAVENVDRTEANRMRRSFAREVAYGK